MASSVMSDDYDLLETFEAEAVFVTVSSDDEAVVVEKPAVPTKNYVSVTADGDAESLEGSSDDDSAVQEKRNDAAIVEATQLFSIPVPHKLFRGAPSFMLLICWLFFALLFKSMCAQIASVYQTKSKPHTPVVLKVAATLTEANFTDFASKYDHMMVAFYHGTTASDFQAPVWDDVARVMMIKHPLHRAVGVAAVDCTSLSGAGLCASHMYNVTTTTVVWMEDGQIAGPAFHQEQQWCVDNFLLFASERLAISDGGKRAPPVAPRSRKVSTRKAAANGSVASPALSGVIASTKKPVKRRTAASNSSVASSASTSIVIAKGGQLMPVIPHQRGRVMLSFEEPRPQQSATAASRMTTSVGNLSLRLVDKSSNRAGSSTSSAALAVSPKGQVTPVVIPKVRTLGGSSSKRMKKLPSASLLKQVAISGSRSIETVTGFSSMVAAIPIHAGGFVEEAFVLPGIRFYNASYGNVSRVEPGVQPTMSTSTAMIVKPLGQLMTTGAAGFENCSKRLSSGNHLDKRIAVLSRAARIDISASSTKFRTKPKIRFYNPSFGNTSLSLYCADYGNVSLTFLTKDTFRSALANHEHVFVTFLSLEKDCRWCGAIEPMDWKRFADEIWPCFLRNRPRLLANVTSSSKQKPVVLMAAMDCSLPVNYEYCRKELGVKFFPTMRWYVGGEALAETVLVSGARGGRTH